MNGLVISVTLSDLIENVTSKSHKGIRSYTIVLVEIKHIRLIVSIHNHQASIIQCRSVCCFRMK